MLPKLLCASFTAMAVAGVAFAGEDDAETKTLNIGDEAPATDIAHWVKGEAVESFEEDKVYVMEFWATWCGPCRASMPHLTELQQKYKDYDVTIIGVSNEDLPTVVKFLCTEDKQSETVWYDKVDYHLTTDPDESVWKDYLRAAGQTGIPCAFIIGKDSQIEWIGHPMSMDEPLEAVVHDRWNREEYREEWEVQQKQRERMREVFAARREKDYDRALSLINEMLDESDSADLLMQKYQVLHEMGRGNEASEIADRLLASLDEQIEQSDDDKFLRLQKFNFLLLELNRPQDAYAMGDELLRAFNDNSAMLNSVAWTIADDQRIEKRDLDLAMKAAQRANELTGESDPAILDTLARVYYEKGDLKNAVKWQRKAAEHAGDDPMGQQIREKLKQYEAEAGEDT